MRIIQTFSVDTIIFVNYNLRHNFAYFFSNQTNISPTRIFPAERDTSQLQHSTQSVFNRFDVHIPTPRRRSTSISELYLASNIAQISYARFNESTFLHG